MSISLPLYNLPAFVQYATSTVPADNPYPYIDTGWCPERKRRKSNEGDYIKIEDMDVDTSNEETENMMVDEENEERGNTMEISEISSLRRAKRRRRKNYYYYRLRVWSPSRKRKWRY